MSLPVVLGIDPDTRHIGWSIATKHEVLAVGVIASSAEDSDLSHVQMITNLGLAVPVILNKHPEVTHVCIETPMVRHGAKAPPKDIIKLTVVAGALAGAVEVASGGRVAKLMPFPSEWKGQVPKPIHQARIFAHYGILATQLPTHCYPAGCKAIARVQGAAAIKRGDWKHVADAIGLARWAADRLAEAARRP